MRHGSIEVQTYEKNEKFFLQVVNDCREAVRFKDGIPVTDRPGHGTGVSISCHFGDVSCRDAPFFFFSVYDNNSKKPHEKTQIKEKKR